jgi:hypothetical protein
MATAMESWDDDDDLQGDFQAFGMSVGTAQSMSSRLSIRSESVAGDQQCPPVGKARWHPAAVRNNIQRVAGWHDQTTRKKDDATEGRG